MEAESPGFAKHVAPGPLASKFSMTDNIQETKTR
jgi:hypothetical protein